MAFPLCAPRADAQKAQHVHSVNLIEFPSRFHERVVGGIDVVRQRQDSGVCAGSVAAVVGKSDSTSVVWACTAISASAMSCIPRLFQLETAAPSRVNFRKIPGWGYCTQKQKKTALKDDLWWYF